MLLYSIIILFSWAFLITINVIFTKAALGVSTLYIILCVIISTLAVILIDGLTAGLIRLLPEKWFNPFKKIFKIHNWEKKFYQKIGIKKWKDLVPELGQFTKFRKNKIADPTNNDYIYRYLLEATYGRVGHFVSFITGFIIVVAFPLKFAFCIEIPIALINLALNSLSLMILRYNTPKLMAVYARNERAALKVEPKQNVEAQKEESAPKE